MKTVRVLEVMGLLLLAACSDSHSPAHAGEAARAADAKSLTMPRDPGMSTDEDSMDVDESASGSMPGSAPAPQGRHITFNGRQLTTSDMQVVTMIEAQYGRVPDGNYWYDPVTGAAGIWGGPVATVLPPGLPLGGRLPAEASGGGNGTLTGVWVNGRELHPYDVMRLRQMFGVVYPGRYWWDAMGNIGLENGPMLGNVNQLMRQNGGSGGGNSYYKNYGNGESAFVSQGCTSVSGRTSPSDSSSSYSYYVGCD
jgi:hypothetical protein